VAIAPFPEGESENVSIAHMMAPTQSLRKNTMLIAIGLTFVVYKLLGLPLPRWVNRFLGHGAK
jgi:hypothetical protein